MGRDSCARMSLHELGIVGWGGLVAVLSDGIADSVQRQSIEARGSGTNRPDGRAESGLSLGLGGGLPSLEYVSGNTQNLTQSCTCTLLTWRYLVHGSLVAMFTVYVGADVARIVKHMAWELHGLISHVAWPVAQKPGA
jgi:hypothetical protein